MKFAEHKHRPAGDWSYATGMLEVAGTFYREDNFQSFANAAKDAEKRDSFYGLLLIPEPLNRVDKNAIMVIGYARHKSFLGNEKERRWHIGYVDAETAKFVNKRYLSNGIEVFAELNSIYYDDQFRPPWYKILAPKSDVSAIKARILIEDTEVALTDEITTGQRAHIKNHELGLYRNTRSYNAQTLKKSGYYAQSLDSYLRVLWLDQQGCQNAHEKELAFSDHEKMLAPGIVKAVAQAANVLEIDLIELGDLFERAAKKEREIFKSYNLRTSEKAIWNIISSPIEEIKITGTKWRPKKPI